MSFCKYKNIFGEPNTGLHSYRIFDIAVVDAVSTIILAVILSYFLKIKFLIVLCALFILGIVMHHLFCVRTTIDKLLFK
jgi:hypothetical protein